MIYMIYMPTYLLFFISLYYFFRNINHNIIQIGFLVGIAYFIMIPLTTYLLNNGYESYDILANSSWSNHLNSFYNIRLNVIVSFFIFLNLLSLFVLQKKRTIFKKKLILIGNKKLLFMILIAILPILILELMIPSSITHWYDKAKYMNSHFGMMAVISKYIYTSMRFVILILFLNNFIVTTKYTYLILLVFLSLIDMYITGNRIFLVIVSFSILLELIILKKIKIILLSIFIAIPAGGFLIAWAQIRALMGHMPFSEAILLSYKVFDKINVSDIFFQLTEGADFLIFLSIVRDFGNHINYILGESFLKLFVFFIPRTIYENKPDSIARTMGIHYQPETDGLALNTTLLGEEYANFGLLGFGVLAILILIFIFIDKKIDKKIKYNMRPFYFIFGLLLVRTNVSDVLIGMIISLIILIVISLKGLK